MGFTWRARATRRHARDVASSSEARSTQERRHSLMTLLKASAVVMCLVALGFGLPAPYVAAYLLRERKLPIFMGMFPAYGGGFFERCSPERFSVLLGLFTALSAAELFAGVLLWQGEKLGALITLALLPIEIVFWAGFALPIPPALAVVRIGLLLAGWSALV